MLSSEPLPSIHSLEPLEQGGPAARTGFHYQDHIAARYCIEMLSDGRLTEVWCETEDDITLLWDFGQGCVVEFIQVKADELKQLWSAALLCNGGVTDSIVAKSLDHDRCAEPCIFRLVTRVGVQPALQWLRLDRNHEQRGICHDEVRDLHQAVSKVLGIKLSPKGRCASHWLADLIWEVAESERAVTDRNLLRLQQHLENRGELLFIDQLQELSPLIKFSPCSLINYRYQSCAIPKATFSRVIALGPRSVERRAQYLLIPTD